MVIVVKNRPKKHLKNSTVSKVDVFRDSMGYMVAVSAEYAAIEFAVSTRRIRQMLEAGTLKGTKHGRAWRIEYPYTVKLGTRGPASNKQKKKQAASKLAEFHNNKIYTL